MPDLPVYGTEPRVQCKNLRGPWQEVELRVHGYDEIDRPEFWKFVDGRWRASPSSPRRCRRIRHLAALEAARPQVALRPQGFSARQDGRVGRRSAGRPVELLAEIAPQAQFLWNNKQVVPVYVPEQHEPWAAVQTKKLDAVHLHLMGPKGRFTLGQITDLGYNPELDGSASEGRRDPAEVPRRRPTWPAATCVGF